VSAPTLAEADAFARLQTSVLEHVSAFSDAELAAWVDSLSPGLLREVNRKEWWFIRRPNQRPPDGDWLIWLILAGRGYGKSRTGAETLVEWMIANPVDVAGHATEWAAVGESLIDGRDVLIQGPSGVENVLQRRGIRYKYVKWPQPRIRLSTGQILHVLGADDADVGRGLNLAGLWLDEIAKWPYPSASWAEGLGPALRTRMPGGTKPRVIVTTTPKPIPLLFDWVARDDGSVAVTRGSTFENAANLATAAIREFIRMYGSWRTGRQELYAELLTDIEGALWKQSWLEAGRIRNRKKIPNFVNVAVAMDPSISDSDESDETGLVCVARGEDGHDYVLADRSGRFVGMEAARRAWQLFIDREADVLVYENNQGMDWVRDVLITAWNQLKAEGAVNGNPPLRPVNAVRGKRLRAEPVAARYETGEAHHVGRFEKLEQQLTEWLPSSGLSPDRLDALVHGLTWLRGAEHHEVGLESPTSSRPASPVVSGVPTVYDPHAPRRRPRRSGAW
jgi:phage terminase large subunit-like protein